MSSKKITSVDLSKVELALIRALLFAELGDAAEALAKQAAAAVRMAMLSGRTPKVTAHTPRGAIACRSPLNCSTRSAGQCGRA